jgi:integrase/recombinase XerD
MGPRRGNLGINRNRLNQLMRKYCALAGVSVSKAHMHVWKHSCGLHLASMGESSHMIQNHLGHVNSQSTDVYTRHFTKKQQDEAWERLKHWR